jgi:hypothetical protein
VVPGLTPKATSGRRDNDQQGYRALSRKMVGLWCVLPSCDGLAGESPAGVVAKQPRSWWPAEGETRPSKRHDNVAVGGKQVIGLYDEESCRVVNHPARAGSKREPSPAQTGEGHGRCQDLGSAAPRNPPAYRERNDHTAHRGTGEIRLGTGVTAAGANSRCPVAAKPISGGPAKWRSVERKSEEAIGSDDRRGQHNPS